MKRLFLLIALLCASPIWAQDFNSSYNFVAKGTQGPGSSFANSNVTAFAISWNASSTVASCALQVDSSADGVSWGSADLIASQNCAVTGSVAVTPLATGKNFVRINVTALTGNGGVNVTLKGYAGLSVSTTVPVTCAASTNFPMATTFITDFFLNLNCNVTTSVMTGTLAAGSEAVFTITQATSGNIFTFPANFLNLPSVSSTGTTVATFQYCGTVGNGLACPANSWQNTDVGPSGIVPIGNAVIDPLNAKYGAKANGHIVKDATITSGSKIVTCPNADCNFLTTAIVGQTIFSGQQLSSSGGYNIPANTTIASVDSDTQVTTNTNATATLTGAANLVWGNVDQNNNGTGPLQSAWNDFVAALKNGPATFKIPCGAMLVNGGFGGGSAGTPLFPPTISGCGPGVSIFIPTPAYVWTVINPQFMGLPIGSSYVAQSFIHDFTIYGAGANTNCPSSPTYFLNYGSQQSMLASNVYTNSMCANNGNLTGERWGPVSILNNVQSDFVGQPGMQVDTGSQPANIYQGFCCDSNQGLVINGTGTVNSQFGTWQDGSPGQGLVINGAATFNSQGEVIGPTLNLGTGALFNGSQGDFIGCTNCAAGNGAITFNGVATARLRDSTATVSGTTQNTFVGTGTVVDEGNNTFVRGTVGLAPATVTIIGVGNLIAIGTGTCSPSATVFLSGPGSATNGCTNTTATNATFVAPFSGTLEHMVCTATTAGTAAGSGVVTVRTAPLATGTFTSSAITATFGTTTSANDVGTDNVAVTKGQPIQIQLTTQAAETLAGVSCSVFLHN